MTDEQRRLTVEQLERVSGKLGAIGETVDYTELAIEALEQTDVLEKIRAEIEAEKIEGFAVRNGGLEIALMIIDKHRAGSEE